MPKRIIGRRTPGIAHFPLTTSRRIALQLAPFWIRIGIARPHSLSSSPISSNCSLCRAISPFSPKIRKAIPRRSKRWREDNPNEANRNRAPRQDRKPFAREATSKTIQTRTHQTSCTMGIKSRAILAFRRTSNRPHFNRSRRAIFTSQCQWRNFSRNLRKKSLQRKYLPLRPSLSVKAQALAPWNQATRSIQIRWWPTQLLRLLAGTKNQQTCIMWSSQDRLLDHRCRHLMIKTVWYSAAGPPIMLIVMSFRGKTALANTNRSSPFQSLRSSRQEMRYPLPTNNCCKSPRPSATAATMEWWSSRSRVRLSRWISRWARQGWTQSARYRTWSQVRLAYRKCSSTAKPRSAAETPLTLSKSRRPLWKRICSTIKALLKTRSSSPSQCRPLLRLLKASWLVRIRGRFPSRTSQRIQVI